MSDESNPPGTASALLAGIAGWAAAGAPSVAVQGSWQGGATERTAAESQARSRSTCPPRGPPQPRETDLNTSFVKENAVSVKALQYTIHVWQAPQRDHDFVSRRIASNSSGPKGDLFKSQQPHILYYFYRSFLKSCGCSTAKVEDSTIGKKSSPT